MWNTASTAVVGSFLKWERHHELNIYSIQDNIIKQYSLKTHELKMLFVLGMSMYLLLNLPLHEVDCWNIFYTLDTNLAKTKILYLNFDVVLISHKFEFRYQIDFSKLLTSIQFCFKGLHLSKCTQPYHCVEIKLDRIITAHL